MKKPRKYHHSGYILPRGRYSGHITLTTYAKHAGCTRITVNELVHHLITALIED